MSDERRTTIEFLINGRQAQQTLEGLRARAEALSAAIAEAQEGGDAAKVEQLNGQLESVNRQIKIVERNVRSVEGALEWFRSTSMNDLKYDAYS